MFALLKQKPRDLKMGRRWCGNRRGIDQRREFVEGRDSLCAKTRRHFLGNRGVRIANRSETRVCKFRKHPSVIAPNAAGADHAGANEVGVGHVRSAGSAASTWKP